MFTCLLMFPPKILKMLLAESLLSTVGKTRPVEIGQETGQADGYYEWSIDVQLYNDPELDSDNSLRSYFLYSVEVAVQWENRAVVLRTLRFGPPE